MLPITTPPIVGAPMRMVTGPHLTAAVAAAGAISFLGAGYDLETLSAQVKETLELLPQDHGASDNSGGSQSSAEEKILPFGFGFLVWKLNLLEVLVEVTKHRPCAVWLFAANNPTEMVAWVKEFKSKVGWCRVFVQISTAREAVDLVEAGADVIVAQGADAGGHGAVSAAGTLSVVREIVEAVGHRVPVVGAGGIVDGKGIAAVLAAGADAVALGTRLLATDESIAPRAWKELVASTSEGGINTVRTRIYDELRGTGDWPKIFNGRAIINDTYLDQQRGVDEETNRQRFAEAAVKGDFSRVTAFAGTGVGQIKQITRVEDLIERLQKDAKAALREAALRFSSV
ncbi:putative oxidoreductase [Ascodesmis nigricans]|uniref:Putative oxidoreductase n=1 Tax=Ascodesmis nigricans TaxID=341454 RepID=A0A4S2MS57_9PEZI|nr:putative oxidoreductase [Ascodesmis nigricans]